MDNEQGYADLAADGGLPEVPRGQETTDDELPAYTAEVAQLWCRPELADREMDVVLAEAMRSLMCMEVMKAQGRLQRIVDRAARHWLALQLTHPIEWEGDLANAMEAACDEIARLRGDA